MHQILYTLLHLKLQASCADQRYISNSRRNHVHQNIFSDSTPSQTNLTFGRMPIAEKMRCPQVPDRSMENTSTYPDHPCIFHSSIHEHPVMIFFMYAMCFFISSPYMDGLKYGMIWQPTIAEGHMIWQPQTLSLARWLASLAGSPHRQALREQLGAWTGAQRSSPPEVAPRKHHKARRKG